MESEISRRVLCSEILFIEEIIVSELLGALFCNLMSIHTDCTKFNDSETRLMTRGNNRSLEKKPPW